MAIAGKKRPIDECNIVIFAGYCLYLPLFAYQFLNSHVPISKFILGWFGK